MREYSLLCSELRKKLKKSTEDRWHQALTINELRDKVKKKAVISELGSNCQSENGKMPDFYHAWHCEHNSKQSCTQNSLA